MVAGFDAQNDMATNYLQTLKFLSSAQWKRVESGSMETVQCKVCDLVFPLCLET